MFFFVYFFIYLFKVMQDYKKFVYFLEMQEYINLTNLENVVEIILLKILVIV